MSKRQKKFLELVTQWLILDMQMSFLKCTRQLVDGFLLYRSKFSQNGRVLGIHENKEMCSSDNESCFICFFIIDKAYMNIVQSDL